MRYMCVFCGDKSISITKKRRPVKYSILQNFYLCNICSGYTLWPALPQAEISRMYSATYIEEVNSKCSDEGSSNKSRFLDFQNYLISNIALHGNLSLLDYGCGADAQVLIVGKELGVASIGCELDFSTREKAEVASSCRVLSPEDLEATNIVFDIIFLGDLLEHIYDPAALLISLKSKLSQNGSFYVQGPLEGAKNLSNFLLSIKSRMSAGSPSSLPPYHVSLANVDSLLYLFERCGLKIENLRIREPQWPAKLIGSRASFDSVSDFIFSVSKFGDVLVSKVLRNYGTRFYLVAKLK